MNFFLDASIKGHDVPWIVHWVWEDIAADSLFYALCVRFAITSSRLTIEKIEICGYKAKNKHWWCRWMANTSWTYLAIFIESVGYGQSLEAMSESLGLEMTPQTMKCYIYFTASSPPLHGGPTPEIDPFEWHAHNWRESKALRLERKEKKHFGLSWIEGCSQEAGRRILTSSLVVIGSGLAGVRKAVMVWLVLRSE